MELEKVTAEIRPRTQWEAIDLGIRLTSEHARSLTKGWLASVYPLALVILLLSWQSVWWGVFLIWWLKPVWERVALHPLSRSLFGEHPTWREMAKVLPREMLRNRWLVGLGLLLTLAGWWVHRTPEDDLGDSDLAPLAAIYWLVVLGLLFFRSGFSRSFALPIRYLEDLEGSRFRSRLQSLSLRSSGAAAGLTAICLGMELLLFGSQIFFASLMIPQGLEIGALIADPFASGDFDLIPWWVWLVVAVFYLNALSLMTWFYTGAGFGLYLNSRTWSEGWDIELKFKGLGRRLGLLLLAGVMVGGMARLEGNAEARRVLESEEFEVQTREVYESGEKKGSPPIGGGLFSAIGGALFWGIMALAVAGVIWLVAVNAHLLKRNIPERERKERKKIRTVAGMNVEPEKLPRSLVETARALWEKGKYHEALSLLYRGAISSLVSRQVVEIEESDTELDCLRRVLGQGESAHADYFRTLTEAWISEAYARRTPEESVARRLLSEWPFGERGRS